MPHTLRTRCRSWLRSAVAVVAAWIVMGVTMSIALAAPPPSPTPTAETLVEVDWDTFRRLHPELDAPKPEAAPPHAASRRVTLTPRPSSDPPGLDVQATWAIRADRSGFVAGLLAGPMVQIDRATLDGAPAPVVRTPAGALLVAYVQADATLSVEGFVPTPVGPEGGAFDLALLGAVRGSIRLDHPTLVLRATRQPQVGGLLRSAGQLWSGAETLGLELRPPKAEPEAEGSLAVAHAGIGITVGEGEVGVKARVAWTMRRGQADALSIRLDAPAADLEVEGRDITRWTRKGDTIALELAEPVTTRTEVTLHWTQRLRDTAEASFKVPRIEPLDAFRTDASLQLARDGELEVVPNVDSWTATAADELPVWGRGLVEGTPTAAYLRGRTSGDTGTLSLLRFVPVPGPAAVVDVAAYTVALTEDGRLIALAKYQVRNERAAFLRIDPPEGIDIVGARIAGETALPGRSTDGTWLIPLKRSLETVDGLLSFPVEVTLLGDGEAWSRRERRTMALPTLDAPIAVSRVTVYLPPRYRNRLEAGDGAVVEEFTEGEGITYGLGLGDEETAQADALLQQAVESYRDNDFETAQSKLDELGNLGASNQNVERLQANVDLVTGNDASKNGEKAKDETAIVRRVKEQARARAADEFKRQRELEEQADVLYRAGDYSAAEETFEQALQLGDKLENLEQKESVETEKRNVGLKGKLGAVKVAKKRKAKIALANRGPQLSSRRGERSRRRRRGSVSVSSGIAGPRAGGGFGTARDDAVVESNADARAFEGAAGNDDVAVYDFEDDALDGDDQQQLEGLRAEALPLEPTQTAEEVAAVAPEEVPEKVPEIRPAPPPMDAPDAPRWGSRRRRTGRWDRNRDEPAGTKPPATVNEPVADPVEEDSEASAENGIATGYEPTGATISRTIAVLPGQQRRRRARRRVDRSGPRRKVRSRAPTKNRRQSSPRGLAGAGGGRRSGQAVPSSGGEVAAGLSFDNFEPEPEPEPEPVAEGEQGAADAAPGSRRELERLPAPEVTASAVSVVIPAIGERVQYQTLLIEAGVPQTISIHARRRLRRR